MFPVVPFSICHNDTRRIQQRGSALGSDVTSRVLETELKCPEPRNGLAELAPGVIDSFPQSQHARYCGQSLQNRHQYTHRRPFDELIFF